MLGCLIGILVVAIIAIIAIYILEAIVGAFLALPAPVPQLIRLLVGLIVLLYALNCLLGGVVWHPVVIR